MPDRRASQEELDLGIDENDDDQEQMPQTDGARVTASMGITIEANGKLAWPKLKYSDNPLPGEDAGDQIARANDYALQGVYSLAKQGMALMRQVEEEDKAEMAAIRANRARMERNAR